jgi:predicted component of type VI protein secretion system
MANLPYFQVEVGAERQRFEMPEGEPEVVVGRATDCRWIIASGAVSRRHARLVRHGSEVTIEDLGSSNGTFVNGERLSAPRELRDQDRVQLGAVEIRFVMPPEEPSADATIAMSALPKIARVEPPPTTQPAKTKTAGEPPVTSGGGTRTRTVPPPPTPAPIPKELPAELPPATLAAEMPPSPERALASSPVPAPASPSERSKWSGAFLGGDGPKPTIAELAIIAGGSFLLVLVIGALLIRFVP